MAIAANLAAPESSASVGTALTRIDPGNGVRVVWVRPSAAAYLVYDDSLDDGGAVPATARFPIAADEAWPAEVVGRRILVAAQTGTITVSVLGSSG